MSEIFQIGITYTLEQIEELAGRKATRSWSDEYCVIGPDWSQYDFMGMPENLFLVRVDGEPVERTRHND